MFSPRATLDSALLLAASLASGPFALAAPPGAPPEIVVAGERPQPLRLPRAPNVAAWVVPADRIEQAGKTAADALREAPGVQLVELGGLGGVATASLRGATSAQTPVYLGGVRLNDEVGGAVNLGQIPLFMIERVEIYRSNAPLAVDGLGVGGAIFFEPRLPRRSELRFGGLIGQYGARSAFAMASQGSARRGLALALELAAAENDYPFPDGRGTLFVGDDDRTGRLGNADTASQNFWITAHDTLGLGRVRLVFNHAEHEQGAPKVAATQSRRARVAFQRDLLALSAALPVAQLAAALELSTSGVIAKTTLEDPEHELNLESVRTVTPGERLEQRAVLRHVSTAGIRWNEVLTLGEERLRRVEGSAQETQRLGATRRSLAVGANVEVPLGSLLRAEATLGWSCYGTETTNRAGCDQRFVAGRAGLALRASGSELYANLGRSQRPPTLSELYGVSLLMRGNRELRREEGVTIEIGARHQRLDAAGRALLWIDAAAFTRFSSELITYSRTAQGYFTPENRGAARALGGELAVGSEPLPFVKGLVTMSLVDPRDTSADRRVVNDVLPFQSRLTFSAGLWFHGHVNALASDATLGLRAWYQSSRYADSAGLEVIPQQGALDVEASMTVSKLLVTRFRLANSFDWQRFDVVGFPLPGRTAFLSLEARL